MAEEKEDKQRTKRLRKHYAAQQRTKDREHRRANRSCVGNSLTKSKAQPVGTKRKAMTAEEKKARLLMTLDDNKAGRLVHQGLRSTICSSVVRHASLRFATSLTDGTSKKILKLSW